MPLHEKKKQLDEIDRVLLGQAGRPPLSPTNPPDEIDKALLGLLPSQQVVGFDEAHPFLGKVYDVLGTVNRFLRGPISKQLGGSSFAELAEVHIPSAEELAKGGTTLDYYKAMGADAARIAAQLGDFIQSPAGVAALGATIGTGGAAGPYIAAGFGAEAAVETPEAIRAYLENPTPENLQKALLTPGFAALMASAAGQAAKAGAPPPPPAGTYEFPQVPPEVRGPPKQLRAAPTVLPPPPGSVLGALDRTEFKVTTEPPRSFADIPEAGVRTGEPMMVRPIKRTVKKLTRVEQAALDRQYLENIPEELQKGFEAEGMERTFLGQPEAPVEPRLVMAPTDVTRFFEPPTPTSRQLPAMAGPSREIPGRLPGAAQAKEAIPLPEKFAAPVEPGMPPALREVISPKPERLAPEEVEALARPQRLLTEARQALATEERAYGPDTVIAKALRKAIARREELPKPQPISPLEAKELGVAPERVPEVLRRQREAEAVGKKAAERIPARPSLVMKGLTKKEVAKRAKLIERGKVEEIPEVYRTMPLETLKGFAKQGVRAAKQELKRRTRGERVPEDAEAFDLGLQANPIFNPRVWETMDKSISQTITKPIIERIKSSLKKFVDEKLPPEVGDFIKRRLFYHKEAERIIKNAALETDLRVDLNEQLLRIVLDEKPTPGELLVADRISRGVPADLRPGNLKEKTRGVAQALHRHAQKITSERAAVGLPTRDIWMEGPKHWYPNLWKQHLFSPSMVAGRLFGFTKGGRRFKPPSKEELGSVKYPRKTDRWWVMDDTGRLVKMGKGFAVFTEKAAAEKFVADNTGYVIQFFEKGKGHQLQELRFNKASARSKWMKENRDRITPRRQFKDEPLRIVEPMTHEQAVAHGLIEDLVTNVRHGFGKEIALLAKTKALARLGRELAVDTPVEGYVNLTERGFVIPKALSERNVDIARLRDGYVPRDVADTIMAFYGKRGYVNRWTNRFLYTEGQMRKWVTVRAPWRWVRQIPENELLLAFADSRASFNVFARWRAVKEFTEGLRGGKRTKAYNEYRNSRLIQQDFFRGEFQELWDVLGKQGLLEKVNELSLYERTLLAAEKSPVARKFLQLDRFAERLYRAEDQFYKFYLFKTLRERGVSVKDAADRVSNSFFNYFDVPPIVKSANRIIPFMPNIAFQYARVFGTALRDRPATATMKIALAIHGWFFMRDQFMKMAGITEEDLEAMGDLAPGLHEVIIPITDSKGRNFKVSLLWFLPYGEIFMLNDLMRAYDVEQGAAGLLRRFVPMVLQPLMTLVSFKGPFGRKILRGTETWGRAAKKVAAAMAWGWMPGLAGQYWHRLYLNATAGPERKQPWWLQGLVEPVTGRVEAFRPEEKIDLARGLKAGKYGRLAREIRRIQRKVIKGTASAADMEELRYLKGQVREFQKREKK
jgi:hypothetical protein